MALDFQDRPAVDGIGVSTGKMMTVTGQIGRAHV